MSGKGNPEYEKFDQRIGEKYGHLIQRQNPGYCWPTLGEDCGNCHRCAPEQELADDYQRNDHR
jgi:hypothetical protein